MKKTLFFSTILAASAAYSVSANATTAIDSLFFKPSQNEIYSDTQIGNQEVENKDSNTNETSNDFVTQTIGYGVDDRLSVTTEITYLQSDITSGTTSNEAEGFTNPKFAVQYRAANQDDDGFYADLKLSYAPDLFDSETPATNAEGSVASGNDEFAFGFAFGKDLNKLSYRLDLDTIYKGDKESKDLSDYSISTEDATTDFSFGLETQYRLLDNISIDLGASKLIVGTNESNTGGNKLTLSAGINYVLESNLLLNVGYEMVEVDDYSESGKNVTDAEESAYSLKVRYIF